MKLLSVPFAFLVLILINEAMSQCNPTTEKGVGTTDQGKVISGHNSKRLLVANNQVPNQPKASNMKRMSWDTQLAAAAQRLAEKCLFQHQIEPDSRFSVGQNIYYSWNSRPVTGANWTAAIEAWYSEYKVYTYNNVYQSAAGHYTQVVWANTNLVGCGYASGTQQGGNAKYYVCNYGPAGNIQGQYPYKTGAGCENLC